MTTDNQKKIVKSINELIVALRLGRKIDTSSEKEMTYENVAERLAYAVKFFKKYREESNEQYLNTEYIVKETLKNY